MLSDVTKTCVVITCDILCCVEGYLIDMTFGELAVMQSSGGSLLSLYYFRYLCISDDGKN